MTNARNNLFSLVELIAVMVMIGIVVALSTFNYSTTAKTYNLVKDSNTAAQDLQLTMTRIVKELSHPGANPMLIANGVRVTRNGNVDIVITGSEINLNNNTLLSGVGAFSVTQANAGDPFTVSITLNGYSSSSITTIVYPRTY